MPDSYLQTTDFLISDFKEVFHLLFSRKYKHFTIVIIKLTCHWKI